MGPTRGLGMRGPNGLLSNLENIGGRILVAEEMTKHKIRMKTVKPIVSLEPPWAHRREARPATAMSSGRPGSRIASKLRDTTASTRHDAPFSPYTTVTSCASTSCNRSPRRGFSPKRDRTAIPEFDVSSLSETDQHVYQEMLALLCRLPNPDARGLLERVYRESEDQKLLSAYTGVIPRVVLADGRVEETDEQTTVPL